MIFSGSLKAPAAPIETGAPVSEPPASESGAPDVTATPTPSPTPEPEPEVFNLSFIGDITPDTVAYYRGSSVAYQNVVTTDNLGYVFEKTLQYFEDDDFTMANFECALTNETTASDKNFTFRAPPEYAGILTEGSVEFVTLGNNHVLDYGEQGYADTKATLDEYGIGYAGRDEYTLYETASGLKIGVYAVSFPESTTQIENGIASLKEAGAEFIIAAIHWGDEGSYDVNSNQLTWGHAAVDAGADVVYGSHPHTLQPVEIYNDHYIFYSMGNWSFGGNTNPRDKDTVIAKLEVTRDSSGECSVTDMRLIPCASSGVVDGNNYQPVPYEEGSEEYERTISKLEGTFTGSNLTIPYEYGYNEY